MDLVLATGNKGKVVELTKLFEDMDFKLLSLVDFPDMGDIEETGKTFEENALIKARKTARHTGLLAIADDSGLSVEALEGRPGVYSSRYAGVNASDSDNNKKLLQELSGIDAIDRKAAFICVIALAAPSGESTTVRGRCEGIISGNPAGEGGFGYDPLFYLPEYGCTMAQIPGDEKNKISHRAKAVNALKSVLPAFIKSLP